MKIDLFIKNANQIATPLASSEFKPARFECIENGALAASGGKIAWVGATRDATQWIEVDASTYVIDAQGKTVTPGLVDCHTHPIFHQTREDEFEMRIAGKSYEEIASLGGGIRSSVRSLRRASEEVLVEEVLPRMDTFLSFGTTTIEAKSGYGLSVKDEVKSLKVIDELSRNHPLQLVPTFLGAHEIPDEYRHKKSGYIDLVINEMLPEVKELGLAEFCDIFCESHVFSKKESRRILESAKEMGFSLKIHADQLSRSGGSALAAELGAVSADHVEYSNPQDWVEMARNGVVPVLLPGAVFFLGQEKYAPARDMLAAGLPVALATDFNPGTCMSESLPLMMTLACLKQKLTAAEALTAATYHSALALNRGNLLGTLEVGKEADAVVWDVPNYKHLSYHFGVNLAEYVIKSGKLVWEN